MVPGDTGSLCLQDELTTYVGRVLEQAKEKWREGLEPTREDDCYVSTVAYDIIQVKTVVIRGSVTDGIDGTDDLTELLLSSLFSFPTRTLVTKLMSREEFRHCVFLVAEPEKN